MWSPASDVMTETGLSLLQTRDLVLATLFLARSHTLLRQELVKLFCRLILWLLWNKLTIIADLRTCFDSSKTLLIKLSNWSVSRARTLLEDGLEPHYIKYLGTADVWRVNMSDITRHKILCGVGQAPGGLLGRVHIDNACVRLDNNPAVRVLGQVSQCYGCLLQTVWQHHDQHSNASFQVRTHCSANTETVNLCTGPD